MTPIRHLRWYLSTSFENLRHILDCVIATAYMSDMGIRRREKQAFAHLLEIGIKNQNFVQSLKSAA